jgi:DNA-binding NarL/FixJ family response regulator
MEQKATARLLLADDHRLLADACKRMLEPEFQVVGVATDGRSLVKSALALKPDVVVLDIGMPHLNGLDAAQQIKHKLPATKLVFLTVNVAPEVAAEAFRRGASAYVLKHSAAEESLTAIHTVVRGESYLSPLIARETVTFLLNQAKPQADDKHITGRQSEILQLLAEGMSMKEVASELNLKPGTVAFHKYRMMETLGIKTNAELLEYAIKQGLVSR